MKQLNSREVQMGELSVLQTLAELCQKLGLRYYLFYGTLLGAVRHRGFIPWDDDVDVAMPRPDYEKLMDYWQSHGARYPHLQLMSCRTHPEYIYPIARLCDTRYYVDYQGAKEYGLGLFVDIYPLDGCGDTPREAVRAHTQNATLQTLVSLAGSDDYSKSLSGGVLRSAVKYLGYLYAKLRGVATFVKKIEKNSMAYDYDSSRYVCCTVWYTKPRWYEKEWFAQERTMTFEGQSFQVPAGTEELLSYWYGDYMQLPPEEEQVAHHYYKAYLKENV